MSEEKMVLMTVEDIHKRLAEIEFERNETFEREYKFGYLPDKMYMARLYEERVRLEKVLKVLSGFSLEEIQNELDHRDPYAKVNHRSEGLKKYPFDILAHAEKVLQHSDKELQERVNIGEKSIGRWEEEFGKISFETCKDLYRIIRDRDVPVDEIEERIRKSLIMRDETLQDLLVDINGIRCLKVSEWMDGVDSYVLGNAVVSGEFYCAEVNGSICNGFEYDFKPTKEQVESDWLDLESERYLNRREAEVGGCVDEILMEVRDRSDIVANCVGEKEILLY